MILGLMTSKVEAQELNVGGLVVDPATVSAFDMFNISQPEFGLATARSASMAGAFASLGGDFSSLTINPAGLGMYRRNEVVLTPMMTFSYSSTSASSFEKVNANQFALGAMGAVFKLRESEHGVMAINLGFGYTRTADYNYQYSFASRGYAGNGSIADLYAAQFQNAGVTSAYLDNNYPQEGFRWQSVDPTYWGATLGYLVGLTGDSKGKWGRDMISPAAEVDQYTTVVSSGSAGEYSISLGMNIDSRFYVGATLGIPVVQISRNIYYGEGYHYSSEPALNYRMDYFNYDQNSRIKGVGVNLKVGMIYRPIEGLRLGFAVHTPTYYSLTYKYSAGMTSDVKALNNVNEYQTDANGYVDPPFSEQTSQLVDSDDYAWEFTTPTRLLFGVSYSVRNFLTLSLDYECDFYNGMRVKGSPYGKGLYDAYFKERFKGSNTVRAGVEWRVIPQVAIRGGYGWWSGALRDSEAIYSSPVSYQTQVVGAGCGVALSQYVTIDLAYQYRHDRTTPYKTFYATQGSALDVASPTYRTTISRHSAIVTLAFRF